MGNFKDLVVWKTSKNLAVTIYNLTNDPKWSKDFGLRDQIRRAAVSIASNIAEGDSSGTDKSSIHYFYIARGSTAEVYTQAVIANEIGYLTKDSFDQIELVTIDLFSKLMNLIKARKNK